MIGLAITINLSNTKPHGRCIECTRTTELEPALDTVRTEGVSS